MFCMILIGKITNGCIVYSKVVQYSTVCSLEMYLWSYGMKWKYLSTQLRNVCVVHACVCMRVCVGPGGAWMICALSDTWNAQNVRGGEEKRGPWWPRP